MCGIGGMLGQPDRAVLSRMVELMKHRGPDGHGLFADDECGLAHSRLAIVDVEGSPQNTPISKTEHKISLHPLKDLLLLGS